MVVATHISLCDDCRAALAEFEAVGGEVMADVSPADMAEDALATAMSLIDSGAFEESFLCPCRIMCQAMWIV